MGVTIKSDRNAIRKRIQTAWGAGLPMLSGEILKDCNKYCRQDQGALISSSYSHSDLDNGVLVWETPYAKRVYYTGKPSKDVNPDASLMWCEKAHAADGEKWNKQAQILFSEGMRR